MNRRCIAAAAALGIGLAAAVAPALAAPNLVTNGGFESTAAMAGSGWTVAGFSAEGYDYFVDTLLADAHGGSHSFAAGAVGGLGLIAQNIATTAGTIYEIRFWLANLSGFSDNTAVAVRWNGNLVYSASDIPGFGYSEIVITQSASSGVSALSIGLQDDSFFLNVDDISVSAVPEPPGLVLAALGIAVIGFARRTRGGAAMLSSR